MTPEDALQLLDCSKECDLAARHSDLIIPALPRIFITNLGLNGFHEQLFPPGANVAQQNGIDRRHRILRVDQKIYRDGDSASQGDALTQVYSDEDV